jgi:putative ABC transport system permease protein
MWSRPGRVLALGLAITLGVGTFVAVQSITRSGSERVKERIAALRSDSLEAQAASDLPVDQLLGADPIGRIDAQPGVRAAVLVRPLAGPRPVRAAPDPGGEEEAVPVVGIEGDLRVGTGSAIDGLSFGPDIGRSDARVALVGAGLADRLGIADPALHPTIWVSGLSFQVLGIVRDSVSYAPALTSVLVPRRTADRYFGENPRSPTIYIRTVKGLADVVADRVPLRITPQEPSAWSVNVVSVPLDVAEAISGDVKRLSLLMAGLVLLVGVVAIGNAMMRSVYDRVQEIGLRRAVGARAVDVLGMLVAEAALIGLAAGLVGLGIGLAIAVAISIVNDWPVAVSDVAAAVSLPLAIVSGALGGLIPALVAVRITPSDALRRD